MLEIKEICTNLGLDINKVSNVYLFGSRLYQTNDIDSDYDYIIIYDQDEKRKEFHNPELKLNCELYSKEGFEEDLQNHKIHILECIFSDNEFKFETIHFEIEINLEQLRRSLSATCSNAWDKCRKKLNSGEIYIGQKSLFHNFRIVYYGIQIAKYNKIVDFSGENFSKEIFYIIKGINFFNEYKNLKELLEEIKKDTSWEILKNKYKGILTIIIDEFRRLTPMVSKRITPEKITKLNKNEIYVFGSNESFINGLGSAKYAMNFGAKYHKGPFCGQTYGICTKDYNIKTLSLDKINIYIQGFIDFAIKNKNLIFYVIPIGCLNAGYKPKDIAPMFKNTIPLENIYLPESFWNVLLNKN